jgi:hypothetical protein
MQQDIPVISIYGFKEIPYYHLTWKNLEKSYGFMDLILPGSLYQPGKQFVEMTGQGRSVQSGHKQEMMG